MKHDKHLFRIHLCKQLYINRPCAVRSFTVQSHTSDTTASSEKEARQKPIFKEFFLTVTRHTV